MLRASCFFRRHPSHLKLSINYQAKIKWQSEHSDSPIDSLRPLQPITVSGVWLLDNESANRRPPSSACNSEWFLVSFCGTSAAATTVKRNDRYERPKITFFSLSLGLSVNRRTSQTSKVSRLPFLRRVCSCHKSLLLATVSSRFVFWPL